MARPSLNQLVNTTARGRNQHRKGQQLNQSQSPRGRKRQRPSHSLSPRVPRVRGRSRRAPPNRQTTRQVSCPLFTCVHHCSLSLSLQILEQLVRITQL